MLVVRRKAPGEFPQHSVDLVRAENQILQY